MGPIIGQQGHCLGVVPTFRREFGHSHHAEPEHPKRTTQLTGIPDEPHFPGRKTKTHRPSGLHVANVGHNKHTPKGG